MTSLAKTLMPVLFVGHGNPMNSISDNVYTRGWRALGERLPRPKAVLAVSAHWFIPATRVTVAHPPRTIHDFYGFPQELFEIEYPAAGSPELAERVIELLEPEQVAPDREWGLDHGTWSVLRHIYPQAQVPVVQLSLDIRRTPEEHLRLGESLRKLRREGVLVVGSGNIVHNLAAYNWRNPDAAPSGSATDFEVWNREKLQNGEPEALIDYQGLGGMSRWSAPTPEHYLPLLYLAGLMDEDDAVSFPVEGFDGGSMSMLAVQLDRQATTV